MRLQDNDIDSILAPEVEASDPKMEAVWTIVNIAMQSVEPRGEHRPTMVEVVHELIRSWTLEVKPMIARSPQFFDRDSVTSNVDSRYNAEIELSSP